jgi:PKD repeat protein
MKNKTFLSSTCILFLLFFSVKTMQAQNCPAFKITYTNNCKYNNLGYPVSISGTVMSGIQITGSSFTWNFGDGSAPVTNTGDNPNGQYHLYPATGTYTVSLTSTVPGCGTNVIYKTIQVSLMDSYFNASKTSLFTNEPVTLNFGMTIPDQNNGFNYYLSIDGATGIPVSSPYTLSFNTTGTHTLILTSSSFEYCYLYDTLLFSVYCPSCRNTGIRAVTPVCAGSTTHFVNNTRNCSSTTPDQLSFLWDYGDGTTSTGFNPDHIYALPGTYTVTMTYQYVAPNGSSCTPGSSSTTVVVGTCPPPPCEDCVGSFAPTPGNYILSTWVKQASGNNLITYDKAGVKLTCITPFTTNVTGPFYPSPNEKIIDGWQRIEQKFTVPVNTSQIKIQLVNTGTSDAFFDDIRIHPVDGNMKSYVYDPVTLRLMAELDENNYATFYEYDEEGALIRVKKETERGIMTIKESRNNNSK